MSLYMSLHMGPSRASIPYLKAYLVFLPCLRLLLIASVSFSSSQVPRAISWALICCGKPFRDLLAFMAQPKGVPLIICACRINAAYLGILLVRLGLGASYWLVLGMAC